VVKNSKKVERLDVVNNNNNFAYFFICYFLQLLNRVDISGLKYADFFFENIKSILSNVGLLRVRGLINFKWAVFYPDLASSSSAAIGIRNNEISLNFFFKYFKRPQYFIKSKSGVNVFRKIQYTVGFY
jgi:hypothetical protein